jgi:hypothetical protein
VFHMGRPLALRWLAMKKEASQPDDHAQPL